MDSEQTKKIIKEYIDSEGLNRDGIKKEVIDYLASSNRFLTEQEHVLIKKQAKKYNLLIIGITALSGLAISAIIYLFSTGLKTNYDTNVIELKGELTEHIDNSLKDKKNEFKDELKDVRKERVESAVQRGKYIAYSDDLLEKNDELVKTFEDLKMLISQGKIKADSIRSYSTIVTNELETIINKKQVLEQKVDELDNLTIANSQILEILQNSGDFLIVTTNDSYNFFQFGQLKLQWGKSKSTSGGNIIKLSENFTDSQSLGISIIPTVALDYPAIPNIEKITDNAVEFKFKNVKFIGGKERSIIDLEYNYLIVGK